MAADNSFDVTSKVDVQEVKNAMDQAIKELRTRGNSGALQRRVEQ